MSRTDCKTLLYLNGTAVVESNHMVLRSWLQSFRDCTLFRAILNWWTAMGLEPTTSWMQIRYSTNWVTRPSLRLVPVERFKLSRISGKNRVLYLVSLTGVKLVSKAGFEPCYFRLEYSATDLHSSNRCKRPSPRYLGVWSIIEMAPRMGNAPML